MTPRQFRVRLDHIRAQTMDRQDELLLECRRALNRPGVRWAPISREAGVGASTIARLARNQTARPQFVTVLGVLMAMGYTVTVSEPDQKGHQIVLAEAPPFEKKVAAARERLHLVAPPSRRKAA